MFGICVSPVVEVVFLYPCCKGCSLSSKGNANAGDAMSESGDDMESSEALVDGGNDWDEVTFDDGEADGDSLTTGEGENDGVALKPIEG